MTERTVNKCQVGRIVHLFLSKNWGACIEINMVVEFYLVIVRDFITHGFWYFHLVSILPSSPVFNHLQHKGNRVITFLHFNVKHHYDQFGKKKQITDNLYKPSKKFCEQFDERYNLANEINEILT